MNLEAKYQAATFEVSVTDRSTRRVQRDILRSSSARQRDEGSSGKLHCIREVRTIPRQETLSWANTP